MSPTDKGGEQAAAMALWGLLKRGGHYRHRWVIAARELKLPVNAHEVNEEAVRIILATWGERTGELSAKAFDKPGARPWKDLVYNIPKGAITSRTLGMFLAAFDIDGNDADRLWRILEGECGGPVLPEPSPLSESWPPTTEYEIVDISDDLSLDERGLPTEQYILPMLRVLEDGLQCFRVRFRSNFITYAEVGSGGYYAAPFHMVDDRLCEIEVRLAVPLAADDYAFPSVTVNFQYENQPPLEHRVFVPTTIDMGDVKVQFDKKKVPQRVWRAAWADMKDESSTLEEELAHIKRGGTFHSVTWDIKEEWRGYVVVFLFGSGSCTTGDKNNR